MNLHTDIVYDAGVPINAAIDIGQIEGGFIQGSGYVTCENLEYTPAGKLITQDTWTYKIPSVSEIPVEFNVETFFQQGDKSWLDKNGVRSSKTTGEPPFVLANTLYFALRDAVKRKRPAAQLSCPATTYEILKALTDSKSDDTTASTIPLQPAGTLANSKSSEKS